MRDVNNNTLLWMLAAFIVSWIGTEVGEFWERDAKWDEISGFMSGKGPNATNRFTASEGEELRQRIIVLEKECLKKDSAD